MGISTTVHAESLQVIRFGHLLKLAGTNLLMGGCVGWEVVMGGMRLPWGERV